MRGRQTDAKALIVVAAEEDGAGIGRVRIRTIPNASGDSLMAFVGESIGPGSVVHTDGWLGYEPLEGDGYRHEVSYLEGQPARASKLLPRVHRVVSLVKRWILGTHQGAVSHEHLDSYLDEFAFRFNRRKSRSRGKLFYRLVQQAVAVPPAPYKSLVGGTATRATDDHNSCPHRPRFVVPASRTTKTLRPAELTQILSTGLLGGETGTPTMPIIKSVACPKPLDRRGRRNRFRFQEVRTLFEMQPVAGGFHPLPVMAGAFQAVAPIQANPIALFRTAALEPRQILNLARFDAGQVPNSVLSTDKLAPLSLIKPALQQSGYVAAFNLDLKPVPSTTAVAFTTELEPRKTFGVQTLDHPPVADVLAQLQVMPSAAIGSPAMGDSFQPFAPVMEAPKFAGDTQPVTGSTEFGADLSTDSAAGLWPLIGNDQRAVPKVDDAVAFGESAELEHDPFYDEPSSIRDYAATGSQSLLQGIREFLLGRRFSQALAMVLMVVFVSTLHESSRAWIGMGLEKARDTMEVAIHTVTGPIRERAAFFIVDDFSLASADTWLSAGSMDFDAAGLGRVDGLSLRQDTLGLESYRYDFDAKIEKDAVGWVVRAPDLDNYYAFKLVETRRKASLSYVMLRYVVLNGERVAGEAGVEIPVPGHLTRPDDFNRVSVRVRDNQVTTLINGWGVDFWKDSRLERGGVGFFSEEGESALISRATVSGNDDTWGLILYGTIETIRSIRNTVSARVAMALSPVPLHLIDERLDD